MYVSCVCVWVFSAKIIHKILRLDFDFRFVFIVSMVWMLLDKLEHLLALCLSLSRARAHTHTHAYNIGWSFIPPKPSILITEKKRKHIVSFSGKQALWYTINIYFYVHKYKYVSSKKREENKKIKMGYFHRADDTTLLRMLKKYNSENVSFVSSPSSSRFSILILGYFLIALTLYTNTDKHTPTLCHFLFPPPLSLSPPFT